MRNGDKNTGETETMYLCKFRYDGEREMMEIAASTKESILGTLSEKAKTSKRKIFYKFFKFDEGGNI